MSKPVWEEEWVFDGKVLHIFTGGSRSLEPTPDRKRLAAQAPAMARLLLEFLFGDLNSPEVREVLRAAGVLPEVKE